jgi:hypothetical protein
LLESFSTTSKRRLAAAAFAVVVLTAGVVRGPSWDSGSAGDRGHMTIAGAVHHRAPASLHLDGLVPSAVAVFFGLLWATVRSSRSGVCVPAAASHIRRRGPPHLLAY